ncbi:MAG: efflux RND transporter periplasmic adaptor subunit [Pseudorhodoplanes sp.]|uniref:efflux RND transporter periplasmic adaptor subunit n=1 Tax=Pseudorhodoplanes sp. TaxID=1934341 RepID=UPI003D122D86
MRSVSRAAVVAIIALAIGAGAIYGFRSREISLPVLKPQMNVEVRVFGIGTVEAQVVSKVGFHLAGKIRAISADQGDVVKSGALLAKLDDDSQRAKLTKSEASVRQAAATLLKSQAQRDRAEVSYQQKKNVNARRQTLVGRGAVSQEAAEDAQTAEDIARGDLRLADAEVAVSRVLQDDAEAQRRIEAVLVNQHELRAPFDARVIARHKELGSVVNAGEAVFTLIEPDSIWIRAFIDETSAGGLQLGQKAKVRLRSEPLNTFDTEVVRIDQENDRVTEERRVYLRCRQCGPQHQIRFLGEQAEVEIVKGVIASGHFIPLKFVEQYDGRSGIIWLIQDNRLTRRQVEFGDRLLDGRIRIASDIPPGAAIVASDPAGLREGRAAKAKNAAEQGR